MSPKIRSRSWPGARFAVTAWWVCHRPTFDYQPPVQLPEI